MEAPQALFDSIAYIHHDIAHVPAARQDDFLKSREFLKAYRGSEGTFNSYRREVERLLHWSWLVQNKSLAELKRDDIEAYIHFCQSPPKAWIGRANVPRFIEVEGERRPNPKWRPFVIHAKKADDTFELSQGALKEIFAILSTYFNFLIQEEYVTTNPVALIRQKSKFIRKQQDTAKIRRLSPLQWQYVIQAAKFMADEDADRHERTLFIMSALYSMYLRISELVSSPRWTPLMNDFHQDQDGRWWFTTVGKGNKERVIAVSDEMLLALKRWRKHLGLSELPSAADNKPLVPKLRGKGPLTNTSHVREIVQLCFDAGSHALKVDGFMLEAEHLSEATVHWLRHTGISDDVKHRPREHVRDDAGHSSSATTDRYIDIGLAERHETAKGKRIEESD
jgi:site-specific recombinase XerD